MTAEEAEFTAVMWLRRSAAVSRFRFVS
jgi:hypothetical protein